MKRNDLEYYRTILIKKIKSFSSQIVYFPKKKKYYMPKIFIKFKQAFYLPYIIFLNLKLIINKRYVLAHICFNIYLILKHLINGNIRFEAPNEPDTNGFWNDVCV